MLALAAPVVVAELGWIAMGIVDTLMVGGSAPKQSAPWASAASVFMAVAVFALGMLLGLDTLVSQAFGAGSLDECHRWLLHGIVLSLVLSVPVTALLFLLSSSLDAGAWIRTSCA